MTALQDGLFSSATYTYKSETLNLCVLAKPDDSTQETQLVCVGDGECQFAHFGPHQRFENCSQGLQQGQHPGLGKCWGDVARNCS